MEVGGHAVGLRSGPLRVRIEDEGPEAEGLLARARSEGFVLAAPGEEAELVAHSSPPRKEPSGRDKSDPEPRDDGVHLSRREREILEYLVDGWSNAEIASVLRIGVRTVRFHLEGIYAKLGVARRGEAAREALRLGLVRFEF
jgi:DNA-binding NarL/FixJ family response regulator